MPRFPIGRAALVVLALSTPALAQTYARTDIVRGLCQPDGCDEFAILGADQIAATDEGTLLRTRLKTFHASRDGRKDLGEESGYVFCSPTKPAIMANQDGRTMAFFLAPFATAESRETIRRNANYHAVYFAICHGPEAGQASVRDLSGTARSFGYRVPDAQSRIVALNRAEDVLAGSERRSAGIRQNERFTDERLLPPAQVPVPSREARRQPAYPDELAETYSVRRLPSREAPPRASDYEDEGIFAGPRRFTNRTLDALDSLGNWVLGR
jgi:hypothetical protein